MKQLDEKQQAFYEGVVKYLTEEFKFDCTAEEFFLDSGDNSVTCRGPYAGKSLYSLKKYVSDIQEKKATYIKDYYYKDEEDESLKN